MPIWREVTRRSSFLRIVGGVVFGAAIFSFASVSEGLAAGGRPACSDADGRDRMFQSPRCRRRHQVSRYAGHTDRDAVDPVGHGAPASRGGRPPCSDNDGRDRVLESPSCRVRHRRSRYAGVTDRDTSDPVGRGTLQERLGRGRSTSVASPHRPDGR